MFVVRSDPVLKQLLTFQYVSEMISLWFAACVVCQERWCVEIGGCVLVNPSQLLTDVLAPEPYSLLLIKTTLCFLRLTPFLFVCMRLHPVYSISVSQLEPSHMEQISLNKIPTSPHHPCWKAPASYLSDIILITKT